jgi:transcriptional regulator with XRE-family HTH domain
MPPKRPESFLIYFDRDYVDDLRSRLQEYGVTQKELAQEARIAESQLARWMTQRVGKIKVDNMKRLELALWRILQRRERRG